MKIRQCLIVYYFLFTAILFIKLCSVVAAEQEISLLPELLNARKEREVETREKLDDNYKELWGEKEYVYNTGYLFLTRALGMFPPPTRKMDKFGDYRLAADLQLFCKGSNSIYLNEKYRRDKTVVPLRFVLSQNMFLHDMLYWEWEAEGIKFRKLETGSGMLLSIIPKDLDVKKGIDNKNLEELLLKITRIPLLEVKNMIKNSPSILKEGTVFSNVENLQELVKAKKFTPELQNQFPPPREDNDWNRQLVGFISKDAVCLIIVHQILIRQKVERDPVVIHGSLRWLSGRILQKDGVTPVLPNGVKEIPERWKPVLEENARIERVRLKIEEENRIEEAKWRVWHDKNGKPFYNNLKMRFSYWNKRPINSIIDPSDYTVASYRDGTVMLEYRTLDKKYGLTMTSYKIIPLSQFCEEDKKQIMAVSPQEWEPPSPAIALPSPEQQPQKPEPVEDDIE